MPVDDARPTDDTDRDRLVGAEAVQWFLGRRGELGPSAMDGAISALSESFGPDRNVFAYLARQPRFILGQLFLVVSGSVEDEDDWTQAVAANERFLAYLDMLREMYGHDAVDRLERSLNLIVSSEGEDGVPLAATSEWFQRGD
jgi:hypothetical protein